MQGLSLTQPWASLVAVGAKRIETRSWSTKFRGWVAIQAALKYPRDCKDLCASPFFREALEPHYVEHYLPTGAIVAMAKIAECFPTGPCAVFVSENEFAFGNYAPGRFGFAFSDAIRLQRPIPCKGALGFWRVPDEVEEEIAEVCGRFVIA